MEHLATLLLLITDLANRSFGKVVARKIVYIGFAIGISFTFYFQQISQI